MEVTRGMWYVCMLVNVFIYPWWMNRSSFNHKYMGAKYGAPYTAGLFVPLVALSPIGTALMIGEFVYLQRKHPTSQPKGN